MAQFIKIRAPANARLAPDRSLYYVHDPDGLYQLYRRAPGEPARGATARKLTAFEDGISDYALSEDGRWIVAAAAKGGSEQNDLYLLDTSTDKMEALLADPQTVFRAVLWRRDSKVFAYAANLESKSDFHLYVFDPASRKSKRVLGREGMWIPADFNSAGDKLVVTKYNSSTHSQLFEIDLRSGQVREITPAGEQWTFRAVGHSTDDRRFLVLTNYHGDLLNLRSIDLASGAIQAVAPEYDGWEADYAVFNEDRTILAVLLNEEGYSTLKLRKMPENRPLDGPPVDKGIIGNIDFCGPDLLCSLNNANTPGIIYRWSLDEPGATPVALTEADTQGIDVSRFRLPELIHYQSFDQQLEIPAFLYTPPGYRKGTPIPFIVNYHGGPEGQYRPYFSRSFQYFLSRGFGVLAPNVRGSSGYGKKFLEMDNYKHRMDSVRDGVWAARWLVENGYSAPGRIGAYGGSYGGFMVVAVIAQAPELFGAACDMVGIVNFKTFLERTKPYRRKLREAEYGPLTDPDFLESISPIRLVERIETPILIAHGRNDPRVPVYEAEQLHEALRTRGRTAELLIFDDEGHGFRKEKNRIEFYERLADFFERHLK